MPPYRIARALAVNISTLEFVQVAKARGESALYIACVEMLPNMIHPMLADTGLRFTFVVLLLSGLSFLGVQPPYADLGSLVRENIASLGDGSAVAIMPAVAIAILTVGVNLLIDGLPHRGRRRRGRRRRRTLMRHESNPLVEVRGLRVVGGRPGGEETTIVHGVDFEIGRGEVLALIGESARQDDDRAVADGPCARRMPDRRRLGEARRHRRARFPRRR